MCDMVKVETVSDEAREDQWEVRSIDKVQRTCIVPKRAISDFQTLK